MHEDTMGGKEEGGHWHHMAGPIKKEFKLAMLNKKEKILKAQLEFVTTLKELVAKAPEAE